MIMQVIMIIEDREVYIMDKLMGMNKGMIIMKVVEMIIIYYLMVWMKDLIIMEIIVFYS